MIHGKVWRTLFAVVGAVALVLVAAQPATANVYASGLDKDVDSFKPADAETVTVSYILNEPADDNVRIEVLNAAETVVRTVDLGPLAKGPQTWMWDGKDDGSTIVPDGPYSFKITASDDGHFSWEQLSDSADLINTFYSPRGVDVNKNLDSKYLGRIYVTEASGTGFTTAVGRITTDGIYLLNADHTDAIGQGDTAQDGGVAWLTDSYASPWNIAVGPDDRLFICDWSDGNAGLYVADPDVNVAQLALSNAGQEASGLATNHGSVSGVYVEGAGAGTIVYTVDEDWDDANGIDTRHRGSVLKYAIGEMTEYDGAPEIVYDDGTDEWIANGTMNLTRRDTNEWFVSQYRFNGTPGDYPGIIQVSADGATVLWTGQDMIGQQDSTGFEMTTDPFRLTNTGLTYDALHDRLYGAGFFDGFCVWMDAATAAANTVEYEMFGSSVRCHSSDVAGNFYTGDSTEELLKQWSPPDGANSYTTPSWFTVQVGDDAVDPEITSIARTGANEVTIEWTGDPAMTQTLEGTADLVTPSWSDKASSNGAGSYIEDTSALDAQQYKLRQE